MLVIIIAISILYFTIMYRYLDNHPDVLEGYKSKSSVIKFGVDRKYDNEHHFLLQLTDNQARAKIIETGTQEEALMALEKGQIEFAPIYEKIILDATKSRNYFRYKPISDITMISTLYDANVNILSVDNYPLLDISDIAHPDLRGKLFMDVGAPQSVHHTTCLDILGALNIPIDNHITLVHHEDVDVLRKWGKTIDIVFRVSSHPDPFIKKLTEAHKCHFLTIRKLNSGDLYQNTLKESDFFESNPVYKKGINDLDDLYPRYYPHLSIINWNLHYMPTLSIELVMICRQGADPEHVYQLVKKIHQNYREYWKFPYFTKRDELALTHSRTNIPVHPGAARFFREKRYYTTGPKSHCIYFEHGCPEKKPNVFTLKEKPILQQRTDNYLDEYVQAYGK